MAKEIRFTVKDVHVDPVTGGVSVRAPEEICRGDLMSMPIELCEIVQNTMPEGFVKRAPMVGEVVYVKELTSGTIPVPQFKTI